MNTIRRFVGAAAFALLPAGSSFAQAPIAPAQSPTQVVQVSGTSAVVIAPPLPVQETPREKSPHRLFNGHGLCCVSDFNFHGCGNLSSNLSFMLGSCRTFFGQTCIPKPPHPGLGVNPGVYRQELLFGLNAPYSGYPFPLNPYATYPPGTVMPGCGGSCNGN